MRRTFAGLGLGLGLGLGMCVLALAVMAPAAWASPDSADLATTIAWGGTGAPHVHAGDTGTWTVTVENLGPDTAEQVTVSAGGSDQFEGFTSACGQPCNVGSLAPGASVSITFSARACAFPAGEVRNAFVDATAFTTTPDPNPDNNSAFVDVKITGPHGETCF